MGLRAKIAIVLSTVLVLVLGTATYFQLRTADERLTAELERRADIYARVITDEVSDALAFRDASRRDLESQVAHLGALAWISGVAIHPSDPEHPRLVGLDLGRIGKAPSPDERLAVEAALRQRRTAEIPGGDGGGPCLLHFVSVDSPGGQAPLAAILLLGLHREGLTPERWDTARFLARGLALGLQRTWTQHLESTQRIQEVCERFALLDVVAAVEVFDQEARVTAHSRVERIGQRPSPQHQEYVLGLYETGGSRVEHFPDQERYNRFVAVRQRSKNGPPRTAAVVELAMNTAPLRREIFQEARRSLLNVLLLVGAAFGATFLAIGRLVLRPLERLSRATQRVAEGDFGRRLQFARRDELGRLARSFDDMVDRLRSTTVSRDLMETVLDSMSDALLVTDERGQIIRANRAALRLTGQTASDLQGAPLRRLLRPDEGPLSAGGPPCSGTLLTADRRRVHVLFSGGELTPQQSAPKGHVWVLRDLTEREEAQRDLEESRRDLERAQRVEAVGRLAGGVAHDLNNVLTAVIGHADLLLRSLETGSRQYEDVREIQKSADRAARLTQQLLAFGRRQVLRPRVLDLNQLVENLLSMLRRLAGSPIEFVTDLEPNLDRVYLDPTRIEQVVMNLVANARDAMPDGGRITIETKNVEVTAEEAHAKELEAAGPHVMLAVWDTGVGIDAETQAHMFEPFFTTKTAEMGTGLGLSTAHGIVKQSGGSITCLSHLGEGTRFALLFPRADPARTVGRRGEGETAPGRARSTVLLVDDEEAVRKYCRRYLESSGYEVTEAADGESALALLRTGNGAFQVLVADLALPGMDRRAFLDALRESQPTVRTVLMSGGGEDDGGLDIGVLDAGFLQKPFTGPELVRAVRFALESDLA